MLAIGTDFVFSIQTRHLWKPFAYGAVRKHGRGCAVPAVTVPEISDTPTHRCSSLVWVEVEDQPVGPLDVVHRGSQGCNSTTLSSTSPKDRFPSRRAGRPRVGGVRGHGLRSGLLNRSG